MPIGRTQLLFEAPAFKQPPESSTTGNPGARASGRSSGVKTGDTFIDLSKSRYLIPTPAAKASARDSNTTQTRDPSARASDTTQTQDPSKKPVSFDFSGAPKTKHAIPGEHVTPADKRYPTGLHARVAKSDGWDAHELLNKVWDRRHEVNPRDVEHETHTVETPLKFGPVKLLRPKEGGKVTPTGNKYMLPDNMPGKDHADPSVRQHAWRMQAQFQANALGDSYTGPAPKPGQRRSKAPVKVHVLRHKQTGDFTTRTTFHGREQQDFGPDHEIVHTAISEALSRSALLFEGLPQTKQRPSFLTRITQKLKAAGDVLRGVVGASRGSDVAVRTPSAVIRSSSGGSADPKAVTRTIKRPGGQPLDKSDTEGFAEAHNMRRRPLLIEADPALFFRREPPLTKNRTLRARQAAALKAGDTQGAETLARSLRWREKLRKDLSNFKGGMSGGTSGEVTGDPGHSTQRLQPAGHRTDVALNRVQRGAATQALTPPPVEPLEQQGRRKPEGARTKMLRRQIVASLLSRGPLLNEFVAHPSNVTGNTFLATKPPGSRTTGAPSVKGVTDTGDVGNTTVQGGVVPDKEKRKIEPPKSRIPKGVWDPITKELEDQPSNTGGVLTLVRSRPKILGS